MKQYLYVFIAVGAIIATTFVFTPEDKVLLLENPEMPIGQYAEQVAREFDELPIDRQRQIYENVGPEARDQISRYWWFKHSPTAATIAENGIASAPVGP
jgi:hypothetical protein